MSAGTRMPLAVGRALAEDLVELLGDTSERIEIAGSIRRQQDEVGDIELVAIPRIESTPIVDLFGQVAAHEERNLFNERCGQLLDAGVFQLRRNRNGSPSWGPELKWGRFRDFAIDLYSATPETWAVVLLIRTGPADFSRRVVTDRRHGGLCPTDLHFKGWRLRRRDGGEPLNTPQEQDVFEAMGYGWIRPEQRFSGTTPPQLLSRARR